jgi:hypothetical protein
LLYNITGYLGYASFGDDTEGDILVNLKPSGLVVVAKVAVTLAVVTSFAILYFCARRALLDAWHAVFSSCASKSQDGVDGDAEESLLPQVQYGMFTVCSLYAHGVLTVCSLNTHCMLIACSLYTHCMLIAVEGVGLA